MSYSDIEALWLTRVLAMPEFGGDNASRGNFAMPNKGKSDHYAILRPGEHTREHYGLGGTRLSHYQTIIKVYQKYVTDGSSMIALEELVDSMLDNFDKYPYIGDGTNEVVEAQIIQVGAAFVFPDLAPEWLFIEIVGVCDEEATITFAE